MPTGRINWRMAGRLAIALAGLLAGPAGLSAQRVLDLPIRDGGGPDALAAGPFAAFWNPGGLARLAGRGEVLLLDVQGPVSTGLDGVALAATFRLDDRTVLGAGFRHAGLEEIPTTSTSPLPDEVEGSLDISESTFSLAAARSVGADLAFGAGAHFTRAARALDAEDEVEIGAGVRRLPRGWVPGFGAAVRFGESGTGWEAGVEWLARGLARLGGGAAGVGYGVSGSPSFEGLSHRVGLSATWSTRFRVTAGLAGEPDVAGHVWEPVVGAVVNVQRYSVGVLREELANGIGAVHTFRLGIAF